VYKRQAQRCAGVQIDAIAADAHAVAKGGGTVEAGLLPLRHANVGFCHRELGLDASRLANVDMLRQTIVCIHHIMTQPQAGITIAAVVAGGLR